MKTLLVHHRPGHFLAKTIKSSRNGRAPKLRKIDFTLAVFRLEDGQIVL